MKKAVLFSSGVLGLAALGFSVVPGLASAQAGNGNGNGNSNGSGYGYQQAITTKAQALNMTEEQLRTQLQTKTVAQVAADQGMTLEQLQTKLQAAAQARWEANGLTQAEIDARVKAMTERQADCDGTGNGTGTGTGAMHRGRNNQ